MAAGSGRQQWGAAALVAVAVLGAGMLIANALQTVGERLTESTARLEQIRVAVVEAKEAVAELELAAAPAAAPPRRGPDPNRRYEVDVDGSPALGPETADVTIVEFSDFQCPFCSRVGPTLKQVKETYGDQVRIVFKHLPLSIHPKAPAAHAAAEAAHRQGKFWEMHDKIFANQREMSPEKYEAYATEIGLDLERFKGDLASADVKKRIDADQQQAAKLGATGTPAFFINGKYVSGAKPFEAFKEIIDAELKG
jgi:protein-disulfide isomerase